MKSEVNFLIATNKLKETPRTGWVLRGVKNPETIAEHSISMVLLAWLFARKQELNVKRAIKIALAHDLCEVYAGDITPLLYFQKLPKGKKARQKVLMKWARLSLKSKLAIAWAKFKKEKKALLKLLKHLDSKIRNDIFSCWLDYEKGLSREGKFVNQLNRIETLLQSIKYFGTKNVKKMTTWWEWAEEITEDPQLLQFLETIQKNFYAKPGHINRELAGILDFFVKVSELKQKSRLYWNLRKVKNGESVLGHIFSVALMAWLFSNSHNHKLDSEKLLKMALCHELSAVYTGDTTPYDRILPGSGKRREEILKTMLRLSKKEKESFFLKDYREEKRSFEKLTSKLDPALKSEILQLWKEYRTKSSLEGKFLSQLNVAAVLFQGLLYEKKYRNFSASPLWEWAFEVSDDPIILELLEEMKKKFYAKTRKRQ